MSSSPLRLAALALAACSVAACGEADNVITAGAVESDLVAGGRDLRWAASGYLARGPSMEGLDRARPFCGATLIAPDVAVTAAHCVVDRETTLAFGSGDAGGGPVVRVIERHVHPGYRPELLAARAEALTNDVAWVVLERPISFVKPAELPAEAPAVGCSAQAIGYRAADGAIAVRASTPVCLEIRSAPERLAMRPEGSATLCVAGADHGSVVVARDSSRTVLVGIYVGGGAGEELRPLPRLDDCGASRESVEGYEPAWAYRDFLLGALRR